LKGAFKKYSKVQQTQNKGEEETKMPPLQKVFPGLQLPRPRELSFSEVSLNVS